MNNPDKPLAEPHRVLIERLVKEADITEEQARELIALLGLNWSSLLREARILTGKP